MDLDTYQRFVQSVTSNESNSVDDMHQRLVELENNAETVINTSLLLTASIGLASEGGEFSEVVKKVVFQGKPYNNDTRYHLKRELGDILWYWANACRALGLVPSEVLEENVHKLKSRYPGGEFDVYFSENRQHGDL